MKMHPDGMEFMVSSGEVMENAEMFTWIQRAHFNHFIIKHPKSWDTRIKADRTLSYNFISSMERPNIIHENKEIPIFLRIPGTRKYVDAFRTSIGKDMFI